MAEEQKEATAVAEKAGNSAVTANGNVQFAEPPADFDWGAVEDEKRSIPSADREKMEKAYEDTLTSIAEKEVLMGTVVGMNKKEVVINIGYKSEGVVALSEFRYKPDLKVGDQVEVYIEKQEDKSGQMIVSHKTARVHNAWVKVNHAMENNEVITGFVKCRTKGGLIVDVFGIEAFLPGSQIDVKPIRDYDQYVGKNMEFKVVKINQEFKNVVVSHKALIEAELEAQKKQIISGLEKGQVLEGTVKNITSYGVFVDLGGVDGLIHITDLSWGRVSHPEEVVKLDDKINVVILDFDDEKKRIALGLKQLSPHPWDALDAELNAGDKIKGKVMVITDYGAFVEVAPGVEGLLHVSEMSWSQHLRSPKDFLKEGQEIECVILNIDRDERKMSLGMKQLAPDPWADIEFKYPVGSRHTAKVRNFTHFGIFAELEEGVDGLIHISDLSWTKRIKHPSEFCNVGDDIEVQVLEVDKENRRLSLGHKQVEENPWEVFAGTFTVGSVHEGTLIGRSGNNFIVALPYGVEGTVTAKHLKKEDGGKADLEEKLPFKVLDFNAEARRIVLSHTRTFEEGEDEAPASTKRGARRADGQSPSVKSVNEKVEKSTLGDLGVLSDLKSAMEDQERSGKGSKKKDEQGDDAGE
ncbi:MAG: 30S ribosomal protein S1 [Flavobacteriales bacterium]|nr:30S ribosomal protein S1 [Flavobacteriales bacterium]MCB9166589.1 30S ribosomal protein S1 [Flavobacteriales bacterium]